MKRAVVGLLVALAALSAWAGAPYGQWVLVAIEGTSFSVVDEGTYAVDWNASLADGVGHVHQATGASSPVCQAGALGAPAPPAGFSGTAYRCYRFEGFVSAPVTGDPVTQSRDWIVAGLLGAAVLAGFAMAYRLA